GPPTSRPSDDVTNGKVAQELPVAPALLIGRVIAQKRSIGSWRFQIGTDDERVPPVLSYA
ncbi:MAG TPA: hypothetical protein PLN33_15105, partial [Hyphomonadaceae bacterium]|nr:hypothetical protein [Hyphomonadaceae bacterium]